MITTLIKKVIGTKNDRELKRIQPLIDKINVLEPSISVLSDEQLKAKTVEFKKRLSAGGTLDDILFEAFAGYKRGGYKRGRIFNVHFLGLLSFP